MTDYNRLRADIRELRNHLWSSAAGKPDDVGYWLNEAARALNAILMKHTVVSGNSEPLQPPPPTPARATYPELSLNEVEALAEVAFKVYYPGHSRWKRCGLEEQRSWADVVRTIVTRLRAQPQASPWVPCSERMPEPAKYKGRPTNWSDEVWVTDGVNVDKGYRNLQAWSDEDGNGLDFTPTHWAPIIRPEPPGVE